MSLADEVLSRWAPIMSRVELQSGTSGRFEVSLDGESVFSKATSGRHALAGEIVGLMEAKLGPALEWRKS